MLDFKSNFGVHPRQQRYGLVNILYSAKKGILEQVAHTHAPGEHYTPLY